MRLRMQAERMCVLLRAAVGKALPGSVLGLFAVYADAGLAATERLVYAVVIPKDGRAFRPCRNRRRSNRPGISQAPVPSLVKHSGERWSTTRRRSKSWPHNGCWFETLRQRRRRGHSGRRGLSYAIYCCYWRRNHWRDHGLSTLKSRF